MKKYKAFTLLEMLVASTLFVVTVVGVITLMSAVVASMSKAFATKDLNDTIRNINTKLTNIVGQTKCVKAENNTVINLYSDSCQSKVGKIIIKDNNILVSDITNEIQLNPNNINIAAAGDKDIFQVIDDTMLKVNIVIGVTEGNGSSKVQFQTAYITRN